MEKILHFIEKNTSGKCYSTAKYCLDGIEMPNVASEDNDKKKIISVKRSGETDKSLKAIKYLEEKAKQINTLNKPLFKFFLDGSRRTYKVDDVAFGEKVYPIIAGQVAVGCCERPSPKGFKGKIYENKLLLALPGKANIDGKNSDLFFKNLVNKLNNEAVLKRMNLSIADILPYDYELLSEGEKYEHRGIAKIHDEMISLEKRVVAQLVSAKQLDLDTYLLKDGSLEYLKLRSGDYRELAAFQSNYRSVVGVSKSFNPELCKDENGRSNAVNISKLPLYCRTPAYMYDTSYVGDVKFSVWYLRIRASARTISPFDGIVKIEKILISQDELEYGLDSDEVDLISANIINERNPVCYGNDSRWANHLYPVYLTETYLKSKYLSDLYFINLF